MDRSQQQQDVRTGAVAVLVALFYFALIVYTAHAYVPPNPLRLPFEAQIATLLRQFLPQGWGFFTKSPRDEEFYIYRRDAGGWVNAFAGPEASPSNLFGLIRVTRVQGGEMGLLTMGVGDNAFVSCRTSDLDCIGRQTHVVPVVNTVPAPLYCGEIAIAYRKQVPWLWQHEFKAVTMPVRVVRLRVTCR